MDGCIACSLECQTDVGVCNKDGRLVLQLLVALLQCSSVISIALCSKTNVHASIVKPYSMLSSEAKAAYSIKLGP